MTESQIVHQILDYLAAERIFAFRLNTSATKISDRFLRAHSLGKGASDILAIRHIGGADWSSETACGSTSWFSPTWIECKTSTGKQSPEQKTFQEYVESLGHKYVLARSVDDIRALWQERVK